MAVGRLDDLVPVAPKVPNDDLANGGLVVDDEHTSRATVHTDIVAARPPGFNRAADGF